MANETAKRLLARIKTLRESLGLTQEVFAERAGLGYKYYQHVEAGRKRDLRLSTLEKLARVCGLELRDLFDFNAPPPAVAEDQAKHGFKKKKPARKPKPPKKKPEDPDKAK